MSITVLSKIEHRFNLVSTRLEPGVKTLLRHFGKYRRFYVVLLVSEFLVLMLVLNNYRLMFNVTESLPYKVFLIKVDDHVSTGDFVAFHLPQHQLIQVIHVVVHKFDYAGQDNKDHGR